MGGAEDGKGREKEGEEGEDYAEEEEDEHYVGGDLDQAQDGEDVGGEGDCGAGEELGEEDLDGVEVVEGHGFAAVGYSSVGFVVRMRGF